jgi:hypothetical protein
MPDYAPPYQVKLICGEWALQRKGVTIDVTISEHPEEYAALYWRDLLNAAWASGYEEAQREYENA